MASLEQVQLRLISTDQSRRSCMWLEGGVVFYLELAAEVDLAK